MRCIEVPIEDNYLAVRRGLDSWTNRGLVDISWTGVRRVVPLHFLADEEL